MEWAGLRHDNALAWRRSTECESRLFRPGFYYGLLQGFLLGFCSVCVGVGVAGSCFFVCDTTCQVFRVSVTVNHLIYIASAASVQLSRMENCTPAPKLLRCSKSYPRQLHMDCQHPRDQSQPERQKNMFLFFVGACNLACESQKHDP